MWKRRVCGLAVMLMVVACSGGAPPTAVSIEMSDADVLADEPVVITVEGLRPGSDVTLWARKVDELGRPWLAHATFTAGEDGAVAVAAQAPESGMYRGVDPMGLFWSMRLADGAATVPQFPVFADPAVPVTLSAQVGGQVVASERVVQRYAIPGVTERPVRAAGLVGVLYEPPGPGPHPGVVLLGGSDGGIPDYGIAGLIASHGFAVLALAYFGAEGLPAELVRIPLEYFEGAFAWLTGQPGVADDRVGVIGGSRGGELALLLGATFPQVGAVVSYVGSGLVYAGLPRSYGDGPIPAAWTHAGHDVPFVTPVLDPATTYSRFVLPSLLGSPYTDVAGTWPEIAAAGPAALEAATIPVERIDGPVLLLSAQDDGVWSSPQMSDVAQQRLAATDHPHPHEHRSYTGTGHLFVGAPYGGPFPTVISVPGVGSSTVGGDEQANAQAAADSWPRMLETLRHGLVER